MSVQSTIVLMEWPVHRRAAARPDLETPGANDRCEEDCFDDRKRQIAQNHEGVLGGSLTRPWS